MDGKVSPAVLAMAKALVVQAGGLGTVTKAVEGFGGFAKEYEQIEKVSAHHGNFWEALLYGQIGRDRAVLFELAEKLEFTATSEDFRVLDALAHARRHQGARGEYITAFDEEGEEVDISFATQNWRRAAVDKTRTGQFGCRVPGHEGLVIDPETGSPSLKAHRAEGQRPSAKRLEQEIKASMPERSLLGIVARTAY